MTILTRLWGSIGDHAPWVLSSIGAVVLVIAGIFPAVDPTHLDFERPHVYIALIVGAVATSLGVYLTNRQASTNSRLRREKAFLEDILNTRQANALFLLHMHLKYISDTVLDLKDTERITIYRRDGTIFRRLDRYSLRQSFISEGRNIYPGNEGCIAQAWDRPEKTISEVPDPVSDPEEYYNALWNHQNIPRETAERLFMKSRSLAAFRIDDASTGDPLAVVVFESVNPRAFTAVHLNGMKNQVLALRNFIVSIRAMDPQLSLARSEGL
jgi:hypothetical protein